MLHSAGTAIVHNCVVSTRSTLVYIVRFGREVLAHSRENGATLEDLAFVFRYSWKVESLLLPHSLVFMQPMPVEEASS